MPDQREQKAKLTEILQLPLIASDTPKITALQAKPEEVFIALQDMLDAGWCFEFMKDKRDGGYTALCKCSKKGHKNEGKGFYARGDSYFAANVCALYKMTLGEKDDLSFLSNQRKEVKSLS